MQLVVKAFAVLMNKVMGASGAESLNVAASIFMGQTEAPLTIRPFLPGMTRSELMTVMTAGMAHVAGSIMAAYIAMGIEARHLLTAVIMTAPGTIMMAKIIEPETETPQTLGGVRVEIPRTDVNIVDAAARGTTDGLHLMLNVIAMLVSFVALVALLNGAFGWVHSYVTWFPESIQTVLGWVFRPIAFAMGVPWHDSGAIGAATDAAAKRLGKLNPRAAIGLGSGLAGVADAVRDAVRIPYKEIPGFPEPGAPGHKGELVGGTLEGVPVLVQSGRFHLYEGRAPAAAALPTRVFASLGATTLVVTNAAWGTRHT